MNLVNAELKSKEELKERLEAGEVFWQGGLKYYYEAEKIFTGESPFRFDGEALKGNWDMFPGMEKEVLWHENIEKPVLCWVSDTNEDKKDCAIYIKSQGANGGFIDNEDGEHWVYATPVTPEDLTKD